MDLSLTPEQTMLRDTVRDFLERELPKERVRDLFESDDGFAPDVWQQMGRLGWTGLIVPSEYGGQGADLTTLGVLMEELGAGLCVSPLLSSGVIGALVLLESASNERKCSLLPRVAAGETILALAFTEPEFGWTPDKVRLRAERQTDGGYTLSGVKLFVPDAHVADHLIVVARTGAHGDGAAEDGLTLLLVDRTAPGVAVRRLSGWLGDTLCEVSFRNARVPASAVLGQPDQAWPVLDRVLARAAAVLCAYMAGGCRRLLEMTTEYAQTRRQFGVAIGTFQRVQDRIVEVLDAAESVRWTAYEALWKLDEGAEDAARAVAMAKAVASDGYYKAAEAAHHVHAGVGVDMDYGLAYYTQVARTLQHYLGDAAHHRRRMAEALGV